ncbi:nucleolar protein 58-like [Pyrus x bretschneideri]|uniref:nucleolar protein 58-like n=1 Tax=Pyrus x bretschneideri TaxID=225117 RepID=UPI00202F89B2|nr:nucleolar protein 58-like [Pyrus x bretschneideri]
MSSNSVHQTSGCFNIILRRLLCNGSVPTHPSDQISDSNTTQLAKPPRKQNPDPKIQSSASVTPGIVARLMGLDSLPETNWVSRGPDLVSRSRSLSFADYLMDFDSNDHQNHQHRRVRTSVSFREVPEVMNRQKSSHDFVVVYLDNVGEKSKEVGSKVKKSESSFGELRQGKKEQRNRKDKEKNRESGEIMKEKKKEKIVMIKQNKNICRLKDEPRRGFGAKSSKSSKNGGANLKGERENIAMKKTTQKKKVVVEPRIKKKKQKIEAEKEKVAADFHGSSENDTSVVSVLGIDDILIEHEAWLSGYSIPMDLNSKVKPSPKAPFSDRSEVNAAKRKDFEPIKEEETRDYAELLASKIQNWMEEDLKESNWVARNAVGFEGFKEICEEFEGRILDMLVHQTIDEYIEISYENIWGNLWTCNATA